jgi:sigma-E factor negative regulatory protein RseC
MIEEIATVMKTDAKGVWLQTKVSSSCQSCSANDSCTSGVVAKAMTRRDYQFFLPNHTELLPGQQVRIGISDGVLMKSALLVYLLPLLGFIAGAGLGVLLQWAEGWQLLLALCFGATGMLLARLASRRIGGAAEQVQILAVLPQLHIQNQPCEAV